MDQEELNEAEFNQRLADELGIDIEELDQLDFRCDPHESDDGLLYGYNVYFSPDSDAGILKKIRGLDNADFVRIGPIG